jgi:hypothetical protein
MSVRVHLAIGFGALLALACTETPYPFFPLTAGPNSLSGGAPAVGAGGMPGVGASSSGGVPNVGSGGTLGQGGEAPVTDCRSLIDPTRETIQLRTATGLCVSTGEYTPLLGEVSFAVVLQECQGTLGQRWTIEEMEYGAIVFASEAVVLNLDVRFAAADDGTPVVLYTPHRLYNQRFVQVSAEGGTFKLSPLHATTKCLSERGAGLELWPCDDAATDQTFEIVACDVTDAAP